MTTSANLSRSRRTLRGAGAAGIASLLLVGPLTGSASAATDPGLGTTESYAVLAGSTVTNTGPSVINGDVGVNPGSAIVGFPPGIVNGTVHATDAHSGIAQNDLVTAYNNAASEPSSASISSDLAGSTLLPGVYTSATSLGLSGDLTLDAGGDPDAVFIFQAGSTLTTGSGSRVLLTGQANPCNVYWQVGSSATIGTGTNFVGNVLALTSISMNTGAILSGRVLARNGAVTLDTNVITSPNCAAAEPEPEPEPTPAPEPTPTPTPTPTPGDDDTTPDKSPNGNQKQVGRIPKGSVDTGYAGPAKDASPRLDSAGAAAAAIATLLASVAGFAALRRRRSNP